MRDDIEILKATLHRLVFEAPVAEIGDTFCYIVGYTTGDIKRRLAEIAPEGRPDAPLSPEEVALAGELTQMLTSLEAGWATFKETLAAKDTSPATV